MEQDIPTKCTYCYIDIEHNDAKYTDANGWYICETCYENMPKSQEGRVEN